MDIESLKRLQDGRNIFAAHVLTSMDAQNKDLVISNEEGKEVLRIVEDFLTAPPSEKLYDDPKNPFTKTLDFDDSYTIQHNRILQVDERHAVIIGAIYNSDRTIAVCNVEHVDTTDVSRFEELVAAGDFVPSMIASVRLDLEGGSVEYFTDSLDTFRQLHRYYFPDKYQTEQP